MVQRVQSLFLLASLIILLTSAFAPIVSLEGNFISERDAESIDRSLSVTMSGFQINLNINDLDPQYLPELQAQLPAIFPLGISILLIVMLTGFIIINFTDRKRQMKLISVSLILHALLLVGSYFYGQSVSQVVAEYNDFFTINYMNWGLFAIVISAVLSFVGRIFIKKDEELVRSVDRIR